MGFTLNFKCTLNALDFFCKKQRIETGYTSCGAVIFFFFYQDRGAIGNEFKLNLLGKNEGMILALHITLETTVVLKILLQ